MGETSDKYTGTIIEAIPTPNPTTNRPTISIIIVVEKAIIIEPATNNKSEKIIIIFLPNPSESGPASNDPKNAPSKANETTNDLSMTVISGHVSFK